ncbi:MAG TPA: efflux RND transporter periplasmic adaptor subunit [Phycisphaerae bacterium]|nr:efflux RND transporter periplasmic adaptor subunit [Phycisphaerae bacterium]
MKDLSTHLDVLARNGSGGGVYCVPAPSRHWQTRLLLPAVIILALGALLAYAARSTLQSAIGVWVLPIVSRPAPAGSGVTAGAETGKQTAIAQAPGWIEADPYPITIPALAEGVVKNVLIVEGQHVDAGQIVVEMVEDDARLAAKTAMAELGVEQAELEKARAILEFQRINYARLLNLHESRNAPDIEWASAQRDFSDAEAQVHSSEARVARHRVLCDTAQLTLNRMKVRSPAAGIVMQRLIEPGTRISMTNISSGERMGAVARLYDPTRLQVRVDVPLADAAKVDVGTPAEITTEAAADVVFKGRVSRLVHEANIQRNTVQVKVAIENPAAVMKPEMLTRVRFFGGPQAQSNGESGHAVDAGTGMRVLAPRAALFSLSNGKADIWVVVTDKEGSRADLRHTEILGAEHDGYFPVAGEIQPGLRAIVDAPPGLKAGDRVRVLGEKSSSAAQ